MAGPTAIPEREIKAMDRQIIFHRSKEFKDITKELNENLKKVFKTEQDVMVLTGSGTQLWKLLYRTVLVQEMK